ncbi:MAG: hypothetical protein HY291_14785 [Planctomycetes bacterium]|nr:hypothetical protein [Planctomycetota bacterium]
MKLAIVSIFAGSALSLAGCSQTDKTAAKTPAKTEATKTEAVHEHHAPHKGTLVVFGEEFAHLELVLDPVSGKLTAYALDGEADNAIRIKQAEIEIAVTPAKTEAFPVKLKAVASTLTGEAVGDSSQFEGQDDKLKGLKEFDGKILTIELKGQPFKDVGFNYPKGNEEPDGAQH